MAEYVEQAMQEMVPELDDLRRKRIFDDDEIRHIVKRRRDFEYSLYKTPSKPQDYLGLHSIFARGLTKFKADKRFWYQYVDFCLRSGSTRILGKTLLRALKFHPKEVNMWLLAADRELKLGHIQAARNLLLRGLRMSPRSAKLWGELLRLEVRLACHLRASRTGDEVVEKLWAPACLVLRRALNKLQGSAQSTASFLETAAACQDEALQKLPGEEQPAELTAALRSALAAARPTAGSNEPEAAVTLTWSVWWREERRAGAAWTAVAEAAASSAPTVAIMKLAAALAEAAGTSQGGSGPSAALLLLAAAPAASADASAALAVLEALDRRAESEEAQVADRLREASRKLLGRAVDAHPSCVRLRLLALRSQPAAEAAQVVPALLRQGPVDLEPAVAMQLMMLAPKVSSDLIDEVVFEQLLRALQPGAPASQLVHGYLAEALARGRDIFAKACSRLQALAGRLWEAPSLRAELLAGVLDAELRAYTPAEAPAKRLQTNFEELLTALQDDDPEKVQWWLRYGELSQRMGRCGRGAEVPAANEIHWRAMRSIADQTLYSERAHRLLGGMASG